MLKRPLIGALLLLLASLPARAQGGGVTHVETVAAPSLRANLLGDPDRRAITVYLPPSYSIQRERRYPVVYLLHGFAADHRAFIRGAYQNFNIRISMDSLIRASAVREMIVVTPNARNAFDGSFYANSPVTGNWEDFIVNELVSHMDRRYRTVRNRRGRGIAGHSMGGFGALRIAMRNPEVFSAVYALSPCCFSTTGNRDAANDRAWRAALRLSERSQFSRAGFTANRYYAEAAMYSPNPDRPPFFVDLPYRFAGDSLLLDSAVAARWTASPLHLAPRNTDALRRLSIAFDAGRGDALRDIPPNVHRLDSVLTSLRIPHVFEMYDGTHGSRIRSRVESKVMPFFSQALR